MSEPLDTSRPFTVREAKKAGITRHQLSSGRYFRIIPEVYIDADAPLTHIVMVRGAVAYAPAGIVSGRSAGKLWNADVPDSPNVELALPRNVRVVADGIREHRPAQLPEWRRRFGLRVASPAATFLRLAAELDLVPLVAAGDSLVRETDVTPEDLVAAADASRGRRARHARRAARLVRVGVDSVRETELRLLMVLAGIPEPEVNIVFNRDDGSCEFRLDLGHRAHRVAFEYDGKQHNTPAHRAYDEWRKGIFGGRQWVIHSFASDDIFVRPDATVETLRRIHDEHGIPHHPTQEWRRHFAIRHKADSPNAE
jgi:hypothetical protein